MLLFSLLKIDEEESMGKKKIQEEEKERERGINGKKENGRVEKG